MVSKESTINRAKRLFVVVAKFAGSGMANVERSSFLPLEQRLTTRYLTKYERARILGVRAKQLRYSRI